MKDECPAVEALALWMEDLERDVKSDVNFVSEDRHEAAERTIKAMAEHPKWQAAHDAKIMAEAFKMAHDIVSGYGAWEQADEIHRELHEAEAKAAALEAGK